MNTEFFASPWPTLTFGDVLREPLRNGIYKPKEFHGRGQKVVNMGELFGNDFISNQEMKRVELTEREKVSSLLADGDLLFARRSLVLAGSGKCSIVVAPPEETTFESSIIRARLDQKKTNPLYFYYFFKSPFGRGLMASIATQTAVSGITGSDLSQLRVPLPPLSTQHAVAAFLRTYDDLIANNLRRIKILEQTTRMLYRKWFVNFHFPGHEKVRMVKSNRGNTPEGWRRRPCTEAVEIDPPTSVPREGLKPFVPMGSLSLTSMLIADIDQREGNAGSKFRNGDTLFARITPCLENGKTGFVQFLPTADAVGFGSTEFIVLRSRTVCPEYVYLMARSHEFRDNAIKSMSGATGRQRVQQGCFEKFFIAQPPLGILKDFQALVSPMFQLVHILSLKNANLRTTRDLLLPKLISGEVSVEEIESEAIAQNA